MTAELKPAVKEETDSMDFTNLCKEFEALERRVIVKSRHIQNFKLETCGGAYQLQEQLEEAQRVSAKELAEANMLAEIVEKKLSEGIAGNEPVEEWKDNAIGEEDNMGDQYIPFDQQKEVHQSNLHGGSPPMDKMDR
jgi:hypothetical protein